MNFLSVLYAKAGITVDGVTTLNNTATALTPTTSDNSTKIATTAFVKNQNYYPYPTGTTAQYVRGDGSLATFTQTGGGGSSVSYYLNGGTSQGTIGGNTYYEMSKTAVVGTNADFSINANGYVAQFVTDAGDPALLSIPGGNWNFEMFFSASSGGGSPSFYVELYKYDGTTLTLIASGSAIPESITGGTSTDLYVTALAVPTTTLTLTDRLAVRVYVTHSGRTITLHTQDSHLCQIITTFTTGLTALNGLTAQVQNFAVGAGGSDFAISSVIDTHTFNLPTASATKRGALSSIDWSAFDAKVDFGDLSATSPLSYNGSGVFSIAQSSTSTNGYLSSTDWNTFNNKIGGSGTANYIAKFTSGSVVGNSIIYDDGTNVGIGLSNPIAKFDVVVATSTGVSSSNGIRISDGQASATFINLGVNTASTYGWIQTGQGGVGVKNLAINPHGGNVGIGTTSPAQKLSVSTTTATSSIFYSYSETALSNLWTDLTPGIEIQNNIANTGFTGAGAGIKFYLSTNGNPQAGIFGVRQTTTSSALTFWTQNANSSVLERVRITNGGNVLIGTTTDAGFKLDVVGTARVSGALTGSSTAQFTKLSLGNVPITGVMQRMSGSINEVAADTFTYGILNDVFLSTTPTSYRGFTSSPSTNTGGTLTDVTHFRAAQSAFTGTPALQVGFQVSSVMVGATLNYGFQGLLNVSGTSRWNAYMSGTAPNYFAGNVLIGGSTLSSNRKISIEGNITGSATSYGIDQYVTISSDVTTSMFGYRSNPTTAASAFTLPDLYHFYANDAGIGAGSAVTRQYGFYSSIASGTGKWGVYIAGTANNYMNGNLLLGTTTDAGYKLDVNGTARVSGVLGATAGLNNTGVASDTWAASSSEGLAIKGSATNSAVQTITSYLDNTSIRIGAGVSQKTGILINGQTSGAGSSVLVSTGGATRLTIGSTGAATFSSSVTANNGIFNGVSSTNLKVQNGANANTLFLIQSFGTEALGENASILFKSAANSTDTTYAKGLISFVNNGTGYGRGSLIFATNNSADSANVTASDVRLTIAANGAATFSSSVTASSLIKSGGTSSQFLKADGSVDSNTYQTTITLTTIGTSGAATLVGSTLNIPNYADTDTGITSLNGLTALTQTFAVGTSGTDFGISSATSTHTFNLPTASASNRGALSSADWTTFNNKQNALTNPITGTGTTNYLPKFTGASALGNSIMSESGAAISVAGNIQVRGDWSSTFPVYQLTDTRVGGVEWNIENGRDGVGNLSFYRGGTKMLLTTSGNLGLGITPSAWYTNFGTKAIQFAASGSIYGLDVSSSDRRAGLMNNAFINSSGNYTYINTGHSTQYEQNAGKHTWSTAASGTAGNAITFTQHMTLDASGQLGLGVTPSAWSGFKALQTIGGSVIGAAGQLDFWQNAYFDGASKYYATGTATRYGMTAGQHRWYNAISGSANAALTWVQAMTLDASGNLGVGTTTPAEKLEVKGSTTGVLRLSSTAYSYNLFTNNADGAFYLRDVTNSANRLTISTTGIATFSSSVTATNFIVPGGTSAQFLKADGSLDSNVYLTATSSTFSYTASVTLSPTWQNTGVSSLNLGTGTYLVNCFVNDNAVGGGQYSCTYAGIMYFYAATTNGSNANEIVLHHSGHADSNRYIYLRTLGTLSADGKTYLQISGNGTNSAASNYQLTFKKLL